MSIRTWLRYLIGGRQAILELAAAPQALFVGTLFVLSAGFAREYDAEDLLHEPWHLLLPFAASLITSLVVFLPCYGLAYRKRGGTTVPPLWPAYRSFLGLFWMTAPLAWPYAVPYERFLSPIDSIKANLWTLGIVSAWRVFLMIRVIGVWMGFGWPAMFLVLLIADVEALFAISAVPRPIVGVMSGVRLTPAEELIADTTRLVQGLACLSLPVLIVFALAVVFGQKPRWPPADDALPTRERARTLGGLAICSVLVWFFILPFTQPEQMRRHEVESAFRQGRISDGLAAMSAHQPADYPPYWDPPPRLGWATRPQFAPKTRRNLRGDCRRTARTVGPCHLLRKTGTISPELGAVAPGSVRNPSCGPRNLPASLGSCLIGTNPARRRSLRTRTQGIAQGGFAARCEPAAHQPRATELILHLRRAILRL